jgi:hypothetical protein
VCCLSSWTLQVVWAFVLLGVFGFLLYELDCLEEQIMLKKLCFVGLGEGFV